jgi:peptide/nickel transport system substrate-binding protein
MANRETVEKFGDLTEHAVGTGPFIFEEWQKDVGFKLRANPDYFEPDLPYIDRFEILLATDPDTTATLFIDKKVDAAIVAQPQLQRTQDGRPDATYAPQPSQFWRQMRMPPTTPDNPYKAPFDDIRVRQAIVQAVDAQQVLDFVYSGDGVLTNGPILPIYENWALKEPVPEQAYDPAAAKALLEQAGNPTVSGQMIWATGTQADQIGEILKQQLTAIGVNVELTPMELAAYYNQTYSYDYFMSHHVPLNNPDPDENLSSYFGRNAAFFKHYNEDIWAKIDEQAVELDFEKRKALVEEAQKMVVRDFPMKFMFTTNLHQFTDPRVKNWFYGGDLYNGRLRGLWLDA